MAIEKVKEFFAGLGMADRVLEFDVSSATVELAALALNITISCHERRLIVENECAPIPPEHLTHIFEPFYRPDYARDRATGGNGLGLYLVATILKSLDIPFAFEPSENMTGMSFEIRF